MVSSTLPQSEHTKDRLRNEPIAWLTTVRADGRPHSVPVWFLWEGESILLFSKPDNQKIRNLRQNPNVVLALDNTQEGGDVIILEGKAQLLSDEGTQPDVTLAAYVEKYGERIKGIGYTPASMAKAYSQAIRVTITRFTSQ